MSNPMRKIRVPRNVLEGLEAVRDSGLTNMFDRPTVIRLAREMGHEETATWIETNRRAYAQGVFLSFEATEGE